jgi:hypothetical protein
MNRYFSIDPDFGTVTELGLFDNFNDAADEAEDRNLSSWIFDEGALRAIICSVQDALNNK